MPDRSTPTKVELLHKNASDIDPPVCEACRAQLWIPSGVSWPGEVPDAHLICVVCYFDGPGEEFIESHHASTPQILICQRVDGEEPETDYDDLDTVDVTHISEDG